MFVHFCFQMEFLASYNFEGPYQSYLSLGNTAFSKENATTASWSSGNAIVSGTGGLRFKSRVGQIDTVLPTACHRCGIFSKRAVLPAGAITRR